MRPRKARLACLALVLPLAAGLPSPATAAPDAPLPKAKPLLEAVLELSVVLPRARPKGPILIPTPTPNAAAPRAPYGFASEPDLQKALAALTQERYREAVALSEAFESVDNRRLIAWLVARAPNSGLSADQILAVRDSHEGWPEPERLRLRAEQAFLMTRPSNGDVAAFFADEPPVTMNGHLTLIRALYDTEQEEAATERLREIWRHHNLSTQMYERILSDFGANLRRSDHLARFHHLLYQRRGNEALQQARRLGSDYAPLARGVLAAFDRAADPQGRMRNVPAKLRGDPAYQLARARVLRRNGDQVAAAELLLRVKPEVEAAARSDRWWNERRFLSRALLDKGEAELAYRVAAGHAGHSPQARADAEFHAGWYALRFLDRPLTARRHFRNIARMATMPRTIARAHYWIGRASEALEDRGSAALAYKIAGRHGATFYGQLARDKLGLTTSGLENHPPVTVQDRLRFAESELARMAQKLAAAGHADRAGPFLVQLAETVEGAGELALVAGLSRRIDQAPTAMMVGVVGERRGLPVGALRAPMMGVPNGIKVPPPADRALLYAIARQESAFNPAAVSHAGARGLMQFMPATARATARAAGLPFSLERLTSDAAYNATLGGAHLAELLVRFRGSYVLTFVGYNAGPGRSIQWLDAYGDPRGDLDATIDWIERIPFDETRDYVQKVMENYQAYRSRLGHPLSISRDLINGGPET